MNFKLKSILQFKIEYYLILLPFFFVLHGFNNNTSLIEINDAIILIFKYLISFLLIFLIASKRLKISEKGSFFTGFLMFIFFYFGWAHDLLKTYLPNTFITRYTSILPIITVIVLIVYKVIKNTNRTFKRISAYLNLLFSLLIILETGIFLKNHFTRDGAPLVKYSDMSNNGHKPDVYFIIADGYAGSAELTNILNFDNSPFLNQLKSKGFYIASHSKSNYNLTPYSLASTFKMDFLNLKSLKENPVDLNECFRNINSNPVIDFFKGSGYQLFNFSIFRFDNMPPLINSQFFEVGPGIINSQTLFGRIERDIAFNLITKYRFKWAMRLAAEKEVQKIEVLYHKTVETASQIYSRPRFVYSHLMMPHYPYYLDSSGNYNDYSSILDENWSSKDKYIGYLKYCNNKLLKLIDHILVSSAKPPIIILMGDHGFREFSSEEKFRNYFFMNLNAMYLPNKNYSGFTEGITNVNEFRCLFNSAFNQNEQAIPDSSFFIN